MLMNEMKCSCPYVTGGESVCLNNRHPTPCALLGNQWCSQRQPIGLLSGSTYCLADSTPQLIRLLATPCYHNVDGKAPQLCRGQPGERAKKFASGRMVNGEVRHHTCAQGGEELKNDQCMALMSFLYAEREITPTHLIVYERRPALAEPQEDAEDGLRRR